MLARNFLSRIVLTFVAYTIRAHVTASFQKLVIFNFVFTTQFHWRAWIELHKWNEKFLSKIIVMSTRQCWILFSFHSEEEKCCKKWQKGEKCLRRLLSAEEKMCETAHNSHWFCNCNEKLHKPSFVTPDKVSVNTRLSQKECKSDMMSKKEPRNRALR